MLEQLQLDPLPREVGVTMGSQRYVLRETTMAAAIAYRKAVAEMLSDGNGKPSSNFSELEPYLVSLCLFSVSDAGVASPVPIELVKTWPSREVGRLFRKARDLSQLDTMPAEDNEKNQPSATAT